MNSIKITQTALSAGSLERLPSARAIPIGSEKAMPVTATTRVRRMPPSFWVPTGVRPKPPSKSHAAIKGKAAANISQYFLPGMFSRKAPKIVTAKSMKVRLTLQRSGSGNQP